MALTESYHARDMRKNVENVRIEEIQSVIEQAQFQTRDAARVNNKQAGTEARLLLGTSGLNAEEMSLLRDIAPNTNIIPGRMTCTWKLSSRFAVENAENLGDMMKTRLAKEVDKVYEHRSEVAKGLTSLGQPQSPAIAGRETGLWGKLFNSIRPEKTQPESSYGMG